MKTESLSYKELLKKRPLNVQAIYGDEPVALVSGRDIIEAARKKEPSSWLPTQETP